MPEIDKSQQNSLKTGVVMDPISDIKTYKDSTFAMLLEAQRRGHSLYYMEPGSLFVKDGRSFAEMSPLKCVITARTGSRWVPPKIAHWMSWISC